MIIKMGTEAPRTYMNWSHTSRMALTKNKRIMTLKMLTIVVVERFESKTTQIISMVLTSIRPNMQLDLHLALLLRFLMNRRITMKIESKM